MEQEHYLVTAIVGLTAVIGTLWKVQRKHDKNTEERLKEAEKKLDECEESRLHIWITLLRVVHAMKTGDDEMLNKALEDATDEVNANEHRRQERQRELAPKSRDR